MNCTGPSSSSNVQYQQSNPVGLSRSSNVQDQQPYVAQGPFQSPYVPYGSQAMVNTPYVSQARPYVLLGPSTVLGGYGEIQFGNIQGISPGNFQVPLPHHGKPLQQQGQPS